MAGFLTPSLDDTHLIEDVWERLAEGTADLWGGPDAACVCEEVTYPRLRSYHIWLAGGSLRGLVALERAIVKHARLIGCARVTGSGRIGFSRLGYTPTHVEMRKPL